MAAETLYLIDAHSLIFQVFHAIQEMSSPSGLPTNAVFGFTRDLLHIRHDRKPDYLLCVFDAPGPTFRDEIYAEYKAQRSPMPDDLQLQIPMIRDLLQAMNVPILAQVGFEADDVIATLADKGAARGLDVFICSSDKDLRQLLSDQVKIYNLRKREDFDAAGLQKDWCIAPEQVVDFQTLVGDSVDNVPGVPGIGPKTAAGLLQQFHTLDNLLAHLDEVQGKKKENICKALGTLEMSRSLIRLDRDVPMDFNWDAWRLQPWNRTRLLELFRDWGFRALADQVRASNEAAEPRKKARSAAPIQGSLFGDDMPDVNAPVRDPDWQAHYRLVNTPETLATFLAELGKQRRVALDLETTHLEPRKADIVGLAFAWCAGEAWYVALRGPDGEAVLDPSSTLAKFKSVLEDPHVAKLNQNIKFDLQVLRRQGIELRGLVGDPMVADYLLHAGDRNHGLDYLSEKYLQHRVIPITELIGTGRKQLVMDQVPLDKIAEYAGEDADVAWRLHEILERELVQQGFARPPEPDTPVRNAEKPLAHASRSEEFRLYNDLEIPLIEVLADMEYTGVRLDLPFLEKLGEDMDRDLARLEDEICNLAGKKFNIASVKQLREVLYGELGYTATRRTNITRAASTDQETLERLSRETQHPLPRRLLEHRQLAKLKGTYVDALPALVNPETGRVHASFNQTVAATGRLSSSEPNLQNIPIRTEQGGNIRRAFIPEPGWRLVAADYSQIELRLLAHFCGDDELRRAFAEDRDIHATVAAQVFGVAPTDVTADMRRMAKTVNFGIIYGMSAFGLAMRLEIPKPEAAGFIDAYFARYPRVLSYQDELLASCRQTGFVSTICGRRRAITGIRHSTSYKNRNQPEREAINMQIQGSAADLIKIAMLNLWRRLRRENRRTRLLLQIHDELVLEVPPEEIEEVVPLIRQEMTGALGDVLQVSLGVDLGVGPNWLDVD